MRQRTSGFGSHNFGGGMIVGDGLGGDIYREHKRLITNMAAIGIMVAFAIGFFLGWKLKDGPSESVAGGSGQVTDVAPSSDPTIDTNLGEEGGDSHTPLASVPIDCTTPVWIAQLDSTRPKDDPGKLLAKAATVTSHGFSLSYTLTTKNCNGKGLNDGYYVLYVGPFEQESDADAVCEALGISDKENCYVHRVG